MKERLKSWLAATAAVVLSFAAFAMNDEFVGITGGMTLTEASNKTNKVLTTTADTVLQLVQVKPNSADNKVTSVANVQVRIYAPASMLAEYVADRAKGPALLMEGTNEWVPLAMVQGASPYLEVGQEDGSVDSSRKARWYLQATVPIKNIAVLQKYAKAHAAGDASTEVPSMEESIYVSWAVENLTVQGQYQNDWRYWSKYSDVPTLRKDIVKYTVKIDPATLTVKNVDGSIAYAGKDLPQKSLPYFKLADGVKGMSLNEAKNVLTITDASVLVRESASGDCSIDTASAFVCLDADGATAASKWISCKDSQSMLQGKTLDDDYLHTATDTTAGFTLDKDGKVYSRDLSNFVFTPNQLAVAYAHGRNFEVKFTFDCNNNGRYKDDVEFTIAIDPKTVVLTDISGTILWSAANATNDVITVRTQPANKTSGTPAVVDAAARTVTFAGDCFDNVSVGAQSWSYNVDLAYASTAFEANINKSLMISDFIYAKKDGKDIVADYWFDLDRDGVNETKYTVIVKVDDSLVLWKSWVGNTKAWPMTDAAIAEGEAYIQAATLRNLKMVDDRTLTLADTITLEKSGFGFDAYCEARVYAPSWCGFDTSLFSSDNVSAKLLINGTELEGEFSYDDLVSGIIDDQGRTCASLRLVPSVKMIMSLCKHANDLGTFQVELGFTWGTDKVRDVITLDITDWTKTTLLYPDGTTAFPLPAADAAIVTADPAQPIVPANEKGAYAFIGGSFTNTADGLVCIAFENPNNYTADLYITNTFGDSWQNFKALSTNYFKFAISLPESINPNNYTKVQVAVSNNVLGAIWEKSDWRYLSELMPNGFTNCFEMTAAVPTRALLEMLQGKFKDEAGNAVSNLTTYVAFDFDLDSVLDSTLSLTFNPFQNTIWVGDRVIETYIGMLQAMGSSGQCIVGTMPTAYSKLYPLGLENAAITNVVFNDYNLAALQEEMQDEQNCRIFSSGWGVAQFSYKSFDLTDYGAVIGVAGELWSDYIVDMDYNSTNRYDVNEWTIGSVNIKTPDYLNWFNVYYYDVQPAITIDGKRIDEDETAPFWHWNVVNPEKPLNKDPIPVRFNDFSSINVKLVLTDEDLTRRVVADDGSVYIDKKISINWLKDSLQWEDIYNGDDNGIGDNSVNKASSRHQKRTYDTEFTVRIYISQPNKGDLKLYSTFGEFGYVNYQTEVSQQLANLVWTWWHCYYNYSTYDWGDYDNAVQKFLTAYYDKDGEYAKTGARSQFYPIAYEPKEFSFDFFNMFYAAYNYQTNLVRSVTNLDEVVAAEEGEVTNKIYYTAFELKPSVIVTNTLNKALVTYQNAHWTTTYGEQEPISKPIAAWTNLFENCFFVDLPKTVNASTWNNTKVRFEYNGREIDRDIQVLPDFLSYVGSYFNFGQGGDVAGYPYWMQMTQQLLGSQADHVAFCFPLFTTLDDMFAGVATYTLSFDFDYDNVFETVVDIKIDPANVTVYRDAGAFSAGSWKEYTGSGDNWANWHYWNYEPLQFASEMVQVWPTVFGDTFAGVWKLGMDPKTEIAGLTTSDGVVTLKGASITNYPNGIICRDVGHLAPFDRGIYLGNDFLKSDGNVREAATYVALKIYVPEFVRTNEAMLARANYRWYDGAANGAVARARGADDDIYTTNVCCRIKDLIYKADGETDRADFIMWFQKAVRPEELTSDVIFDPAQETAPRSYSLFLDWDGDGQFETTYWYQYDLTPEDHVTYTYVDYTQTSWNTWAETDRYNFPIVWNVSYDVSVTNFYGYSSAQLDQLLPKTYTVLDTIQLPTANTDTNWFIGWKICGLEPDRGGRYFAPTNIITRGKIVPYDWDDNYYGAYTNYWIGLEIDRRYTGYEALTGFCEITAKIDGVDSTNDFADVVAASQDGQTIKVMTPDYGTILVEEFIKTSTSKAYKDTALDLLEKAALIPYGATVTNNAKGATWDLTTCHLFTTDTIKAFLAKYGVADSVERIFKKYGVDYDVLVSLGNFVHGTLYVDQDLTIEGNLTILPYFGGKIVVRNGAKLTIKNGNVFVAGYPTITDSDNYYNALKIDAVALAAQAKTAGAAIQVTEGASIVIDKDTLVTPAKVNLALDIDEIIGTNTLYGVGQGEIRDIMDWLENCEPVQTLIKATDGATVIVDGTVASECASDLIDAFALIDATDATVIINDGAVVDNLNSLAISVTGDEGVLTLNGGTISGTSAVYFGGKTITVPHGSTVELYATGEAEQFFDQGMQVTGDALIVDAPITTECINDGCFSSKYGKAIKAYNGAAYFVSTNVFFAGVSPSIDSDLIIKGYDRVENTDPATKAIWPDTVGLRTFQLYYEFNGGKEVVSLERNYNVESTAALQGFGYVEKDAYTFVCWTNQYGEVVEDFTKVVEELIANDYADVTVYAQWVKNAYTATLKSAPTVNTVTYKDQDRVFTETTVGFDKETTVTLPTLECAGYEFLGWFDAAGTKYTVLPNAGELVDCTLTAYWKLITYAITYVDAYGNESAASYDVENNVTFNADAKRDGFDFQGWTIAGTTVLSTKGYADDVTVTANWTSKASGQEVFVKDSDVAFNPTATVNYSGYVVKSGKILGSVSFTANKATKATTKNPSYSTVRMTLKLIDEKQSTKSFKVEVTGEGPAKFNLGTMLGTAYINNEGVEARDEDDNNGFTVVASPNATAVKQNYTVSYATTVGDAVVGSTTLRIAMQKTGKASVSGTLYNGKKFSVSAQAMTGRNGSITLPIAYSTSYSYNGYSNYGGFAGVVRIAADGTITFDEDHLASIIVYVDGTLQDANLAAQEIGKVATAKLTNGATVSYMVGADEAVGTVKSGRISFTGYTGVSLSYTYTSGALSGQFKILPDGASKQITATVTGVMVDGKKGFGTAVYTYNKVKYSLPVEVEVAE